MNTHETKALAVVILAAGQGTRMNDPSKPKVLFELRGKPMIDHVIARARELSPKKIVIVVGYGREHVTAHVLERFGTDGIEFAVQEPQLGTGHAMMQTAANLEGFMGDVLVLYGDVPMLTTTTLKKLITAHDAVHAGVTILTAVPDDPAEYGRIIRNANGGVERIVENKDANAAEKKIKEINSGIYVFDAQLLYETLSMLTPKNAQGEYYLTDIIGIYRSCDIPVAAQIADDPREVAGINSVVQLQQAEATAG